MLNAVFGRSVFGQILFGYGQHAPITTPILPAPFDRTFIVPQAGLLWDGQKTPAELKNFSFNWAAEIASDLIASSAWSCSAYDLIILENSVDVTETIATVLLSEGTQNNIYDVTNTIITQSGLELTATFVLTVNQYNL